MDRVRYDAIRIFSVIWDCLLTDCNDVKNQLKADE